MADRSRTVARQKLQLLALVLVASGFAGRFTLAETLPVVPGSAHPDALLPVAASEEAVLKEAAGELEVLEKALADYTAKSDGELKTASPQPVAVAHVAARRLVRWGERLAMAGEPCGFDLQFRGEGARQKLEAVIVRIRMVRSADISRLYAAAQNLSRKNVAQLGKVKGAPEVAFEQLEKLIDEVEGAAVWYEGGQRDSLLQDFAQAQKKVRDEVFAARKVEAQKRLVDARGEYNSLVLAVQKEATEIPQAIGDTGTAMVADKSLTGPQSLGYLADRLRQLQSVTLAYQMRIWIAGQNDPALLEGWPAIEQDAQRLCAQLLRSLAQVIERDAARITAAEAAVLYTAYLQAAAPWVATANDSSLAAVLTPALEQLANKGPTLAAEVADYTRLTDDLLRWRRRAADAQAEEDRAECLPLPQVVWSAARAGGPAGLIPSTAPEGEPPALRGPLPAAIRELNGKLVGQKVVLSQVLGEAAGPWAHGSLYARRTLGTATVPPALVAGWDAQLKSDLQVTPEAPPLSLAAAVACARLEAGAWTEVGGDVTGYSVLGLVPHFLALTPADAVTLPFGTLPSETVGRDGAKQLWFRVEVKPRWARQDYFVVWVP